MTTSIDSLFRQNHNPAPVIQGKFVKEDELNQIQKDLYYLMQENKKLTDMIHQYQNPVAIPTSTPIPTPYPTPIPTPYPTPVPPQSPSPPIFYSASGQPVLIPENSKTITIVIDTNKMIYLLLFIILVIMILKK